MNRCEQIILLIARTLICLIFILGGINQTIHWYEVEESLVIKLCHWHAALENFHIGEKFVEILILSAPILLSIAIFLQLIGGALVLFGVKVRLGAFLLILFLIPVTLVYHGFWFYLGGQPEVQFALFIKNVSIIGTLLFLTFGPNFEAKKKALPPFSSR